MFIADIFSKPWDHIFSYLQFSFFWFFWFTVLPPTPFMYHWVICTHFEGTASHQDYGLWAEVQNLELKAGIIQAIAAACRWAGTAFENIRKKEVVWRQVSNQKPADSILVWQVLKVHHWCRADFCVASRHHKVSQSGQLDFVPCYFRCQQVYLFPYSLWEYREKSSYFAVVSSHTWSDSFF